MTTTTETDTQYYVNAIKSHGLRVFMRQSSDQYRPSEDCIYTTQDGKHLAYLQWSKLGIKITTMHKPCKGHGTGFIVVDNPEPTEKELMAGFVYMPSWTSGNLSDIVKWPSIEKYIANNSFNAQYKEV